MTKNNRRLIIAVIILLVLSALLLTGLMIFVITSDGIENITISDNSISFDEAYDVSAYDCLKVTTAGDVTLIESNNDKIQITARGGNKKYFDVSSENATISVTYYQKNTFLFTKILQLPDIYIYLPSDSLDNIEINSEMGDTEIEGELDTDLKISSDVGDIKADSLYGFLDIHTDCGDIEINNTSINKNSSVSTDLGDIKIEHTNDIRIDYETSLGDCKIKNNNIKSNIILNVKTDMGDIEIND